MHGGMCYLISDMLQEALSDAMQAQRFLQSVALARVGMENEAQAALREGTTQEAKRNTTPKQK